MEVHSHSHTPRKKWSHYFWEFLMLFFAVFCGFLAEYQLEHVIENQREEKLMQSLVEDLHADEEILSNYHNWRMSVNRDFDSLLILLAKPDCNKEAYLIHRKANATTLIFGLPDLHEGTIQQLKNAGGFRLIRKKPVLNEINKHYLDVNRMKSSYEIEVLLRVELVKLMSGLLDANALIDKGRLPGDYVLMTNDRIEINKVMNGILAAKQINQRLIDQLDYIKGNTIKLRKVILKAYPQP